MLTVSAHYFRIRYAIKHPPFTISVYRTIRNGVFLLVEPISCSRSLVLPVVAYTAAADAQSLGGEYEGTRTERKNILVTGVSRPAGIGAHTARLLARYGAHVVVHGFSAYDTAMNYPDARTAYTGELVAELQELGYLASEIPASDMSQPGEAERIINTGLELVGKLDGLVLNHAYSTNTEFGSWNEEDIMLHYRVNVVASMLMIQRFAGSLPAGKRGAITLFTSGQYLGPMIDEVAYGLSKDATIGLCRQQVTDGFEVSHRIEIPGQDACLKEAAYRASSRTGLAALAALASSKRTARRLVAAITCTPMPIARSSGA